MNDIINDTDFNSMRPVLLRKTCSAAHV